MIDYIVGILILMGGLLALIAGIGVVRLPDVLIRMHAATKVGTLASGMMMLAAALHFGSADVAVLGAVIVVFLFLTAPIAGHMIGRAALRTGVELWNTRRFDTAEPEDEPGI